MNKNIPEKHLVSVLFQNIEQKIIGCLVYQQPEIINKEHILAIAKSHNIEIISQREDAAAFEFTLYKTSVRFLIRNLEKFEELWPNLIRIVISGKSDSINKFIKREIKKNKKTFPD